VGKERKGERERLDSFGDRGGHQLHTSRELRHPLAFVCLFQARTRDPTGVHH
jgi:hypothetical protein